MPLLYLILLLHKFCFCPNIISVIVYKNLSKVIKNMCVVFRKVLYWIPTVATCRVNCWKPRGAFSTCPSLTDGILTVFLFVALFQLLNTFYYLFTEINLMQNRLEEIKSIVKGFSLGLTCFFSENLTLMKFSMFLLYHIAARINDAKMDEIAIA